MKLKMESNNKVAKSMTHYYNAMQRRLENDERYYNGKIYMIDVDGDIYIGSTIKTLDERLQHHQENRHKRDRPESKLYGLIEKRNGWHGVEIQLLENYPCRNDFMLRVRETRWMTILQSTLNIKHHNYFFNQYYWENKDKIQNYKKEYAKKNAEKEAERKKAWYEANKQRLLQAQKEKYLNNHENELAHRRIAYKIKHPKKEVDKEAITKRKQERYEKILEKDRQKSNCPHCNKELSYGSIRKHKKACPTLLNSV